VFHQHPVWLLLAALALLLCVGALLAGYQLLAQQREREAHLRHVTERRAALSRRPAPVSQVRIPAPQAAAVNAAVYQLNLPWRDLQQALAAATPPAVALLALEPDARKRVLKISAEVKNSDDMIAYVEQLKRQEFFRDVTLTKHEVSELDPNRPIRFQLDAEWSAP
jgi:Tfp pilus assembly protein PilN